MEIQRPIIKLMVLHSNHDKSDNSLSRRESLPGKSKWRISLSRSPSSSSSSKSNSSSPSKTEIPTEFLCPISASLMADPVIVSSGHSYERACVIASKTLGFTPTPPPDFSTVIPNLALKSAILSWCDRRSFPPPKPLDQTAAEKLVLSLMEKTHRPSRKVSVSEKELIQAIKDKPSVRLDHAATELDRRPNHYFNSSSDESVASSSRTLQLATRPSCFSSPSSAEIESLEPNPSPEEEALLVKLKSNRISEIEEALISIRRVTRLDEGSRISLCTARLISSLKSLIVSRYATVQVNATAVLVNLSLVKSNKVKIVRSGIVPPLIDVLKCGSSEAQEHSAGAIFSLALEDENKTAIGVLGALEPLLHLVRVGTELTRHDSALALYHLSLVQSNRGKLVKLGAVQVLLNMARLGQTMNRVLLILCNMASCPVSRPALLDSGAVECMVGILRGPREVTESTRESCVAVLYGLSHDGGLRFKGLALAANAVEELTKVERSGRERAKQKAKRVLEVMRAKMEDDSSPENEEIDWEELLNSGSVTRSQHRLGGDGEKSCVNSSEF
ncbi:U-box domain-containing protein 40 [Raphanus sativus]|uniref:RING-type E3 ubiquitin transferase n=1 Tax=Raphanus sativus TaxID=3726 RepID=A0A6J0MYR1_RAPSA|nr:U-box domain-containing protein 40 [Raphanus sativus]KAJ4902467.1 U-box domain-containing protein 40 [Raphanus sativus]